MNLPVNRIGKAKARNLYNRGLGVILVPNKASKLHILSGDWINTKESREVISTVDKTMGMEFDRIESISKKEYCNDVNGYHFNYYVFDANYKNYLRYRKCWDDLKKDCTKEELKKKEITIDKFISSMLVGNYEYSTILKRIKG